MSARTITRLVYNTRPASRSLGPDRPLRASSSAYPASLAVVAGNGPRDPWPRVVRGGIAVFDEYALGRWSESEAVDRFVRAHGLTLRPVLHAGTPTAYVVKP
jgi:hypothetical protein